MPVLMVHSGTATPPPPHRETRYRPGPDPHWPARHRFGPASSSPVISDLHSESSSTSTHSCGSFISPATGDYVQFIARDAVIPTGVPVNYPANQFPVPDREDTAITAHSPASLLPTTPTTLSGSTQVDDSVMQISGTGHWFLEGWIGDHYVEFLVDCQIPSIRP